MSRSWTAALVFCAAQAALAQRAPVAPAPVSPRPAPESSAGALRPLRLGTSHKVDVIAPGERVETIIDRMRSIKAAPAGDQPAPADRGPVRPPDKAGRDGDRGPPDARRAPGGPPPPGTGNNAPPPDRRRR